MPVLLLAYIVKLQVLVSLHDCELEGFPWLSFQWWGICSEYKCFNQLVGQRSHARVCSYYAHRIHLDLFFGTA